MKPFPQYWVKPLRGETDPNPQTLVGMKAAHGTHCHWVNSKARHEAPATFIKPSCILSCLCIEITATYLEVRERGGRTASVVPRHTRKYITPYYMSAGPRPAGPNSAERDAKRTTHRPECTL